MKVRSVLVLSWNLFVAALAADEYAVRPGQFGVEPSPVLSPAAALESFQLVEGYVIEPVAAEPMVEDPVAMAFDEDGRLFVAEMRGFTLDVNGTNEFEPSGRIRLLVDRDGDGTMDEARIFMDGLVLPRSLCAYRGGLLVAEHDKLWHARDTDGDGRADEQELVDDEYATAGSVEHRPNGLLLAIDNWIYNGASTKRYRWKNSAWEIQKVQKRGQWGITQDNHGRLFYNFNWSQLHADMVPPGYIGRNPDFNATFAINVGLTSDQRVYPIRPNTAVNRGYTPGVLDERGRLTAFASACGPHYYRGGRFAEMTDDVFVCGPCANIVKCNKLTRNGVSLSAANAYEDREFLASTDERFRPVQIAGGPDGALYIVDMYRGVVQQWEYMTKYLREESRLRGLFEPVHRGRIYRVRKRGGRRVEPVRFSTLSNDGLLGMLSDRNGWRRDQAQRLLIQRAERRTGEKLAELARNGATPITRIHALWTLAGLGHDRPGDLMTVLEDRNSQVRIAAMRVLEEELTEGRRDVRRALREQLGRNAANETIDVQLQTILTLGELDPGSSLEAMIRLIRDNAEVPVMREALMSSLGGLEYAFLKRLMAEPEWADRSIGRELMLESLAGVIANQGESDVVDGLLKLLDAEGNDLDWKGRAVLAGVSMRARGRRRSPLNVANEPGFVRRLEKFSDAGLRRDLRVLADAIEWPGHPVKRETGAGRPLTKTERGDFVKGRQLFANYCAACHGTDGRGMKPLAPPLVDSEWVNGAEGRLIRIVLHGLEGPVKVAGKTWASPEILPSMPSMATLRSVDLRAILTYVRRAWGHTADPIGEKTVTKLRQLNFGRLTPWTEAELLKIPEDEVLRQGYRPVDEK